MDNCSKDLYSKFKQENISGIINEIHFNNWQFQCFESEAHTICLRLNTVLNWVMHG